MSTLRTELATSLRSAVVGNNPALIVAEYVLERIPHIFEEDWDNYRNWRAQLAEAIEVDPCDISITGSACVGVSLNPNKNFSDFDEGSDVDVAVVSPYHFDVAWRCLRAFQLADARTPSEREAIKRHRTNYIYWGCIAIDKILRLMPFSRQWTVASSQMCGVTPTDGRVVNFRIYRDYDSLRSYHINGIRKLRAQLLEVE